MLRYLRFLTGLLFVSALVSGAGYAQTELAVTIRDLDTTHFPEQTFYLDIHGPERSFYSGLTASDIQLQEDGQPLEIQELSILTPGVQLVVALNPARTFSIRDSQGLSRYDYLVEHLQEWASRRAGSSLDDVSLLAAGTASQTHSDEPGQVIQALSELEVQEFPQEPDLDLLFQAVTVAADPTPRPGMERAVLFVTAPLGQTLETGLQNLVSQTRQQNVRIYVWMVAAADVFDSPQADQLRSLAEQTGGEFFAYSGFEELPSPENYLRQLRSVYFVRYISRIREPGNHTLSLSLAGEADSVQFAYELDIQSPQPAFLEPPAAIERALPDNFRLGLGEQAPGESFEPKQQTLEFMVVFPDNRPRPMTRSELYVDGELVSEENAPPFGQLEWDLRQLTTPERHILQIVVEDELGLEGRSIELPVEVEVRLPAGNLLWTMTPHAPALLGLAVVLLLSLVLLVLVLSGRIQPGRFRFARRLRRLSPRRRKAAEIPVENSPAAGIDLSNPGGPLSDWVNRLHWPQSRVRSQAPAYLVFETQDQDEPTGAPVPLFSDEITFGSEREHATILLDDPTVSSLHARLVRLPEEIYWLRDEGSVAGTWVNYVEIPHAGLALEHNDLIQIGRVVLRFKLREPKYSLKPVIRKVDLKL